MRAKFIYEKFTQESDPIDDLKIGLKHKRIFKDIVEAAQWAYLFPEICSEGIINDWGKYISDHKPQISISIRGQNLSFNNDYYSPLFIIKWFKQNIRFIPYDEYTIGLKDAKHIYDLLEKIVKEKEKLNEKFTEKSDPVRDLNVGFLDRTKEKYNYCIMELDFEDYILEKISDVFKVNSTEDLFYLADNTADASDYDPTYSIFNEYEAFQEIKDIIKSGKCQIIFKETFNTGRTNIFNTTITIYETPIGKIASITHEHGSFKSYFGDVSAFLNIREK